MAITAQDTTIKPGYKQTEVGMIPENWEVKKLEELGSWKGGATPSMANSSFWVNGTIYWASSGDVKTSILSKTASMITEAAVKQSSTTLLKEGAILIVTRSGILRKYLPVAKNAVPIAINQDIKALIPNSKVSTDYLLQVLSTRGPDILTRCMKAGTTVESVEYTWLKKYQIPLPSPLEQQAIATALSDVDALITSLDKLIAKKRDIKQAAMQQLLTGKMRLPGFGGGCSATAIYKQTEVGMIPEDWKIEKLGNCLLGVPQYGINAPAVQYSDSLPIYIRITDITDDGRFSPENIASVKHVSADKYILKTGDLVFARTGASVGKTYLYKPEDGNLVFAGYLIRVKVNPSQLLSEYLAAYVKTEHYWNWVRVMSMRSGQPGINGHEYAQLPLPLPNLPEQIAIATILSDMDAEIVALEQKRDKIRALKQGMMQELLTGKTRLL